MAEIHKGNTYTDGAERRGWFVGPFMPANSLLHSNQVEIKWVEHKAGEVREGWVEDEKRTSLCVLLAGKYLLHFDQTSALLEEPGDYVLWGEDVAHKWEAIEDSLIVTVRWNLASAP